MIQMVSLTENPAVADDILALVYLGATRESCVPLNGCWLHVGRLP